MPDPADLVIDVLGLVSQFAQDPPRLLLVVLPDQPPRRFDKNDAGDAQQNRERGAGHEHVAPRVIVVAENCGGDIRQQDADGDGELVAGYERSARPRRRDLGNIERHAHGHRAERQADYRSAGDQPLDRRCQAAAECAEREGRRSGGNDVAPPKSVANLAGDQRADHGAGQQHDDQQAGNECAELPVLLNEWQRTGNDAGIEAEQQATGRGNGGHKKSLEIRNTATHRSHPVLFNVLCEVIRGGSDDTSPIIRPAEQRPSGEGFRSTKSLCIKFTRKHFISVTDEKEHP